MSYMLWMEAFICICLALISSCAIWIARCVSSMELRRWWMRLNSPFTFSGGCVDCCCGSCCVPSRSRSDGHLLPDLSNQFLRCVIVVSSGTSMFLTHATTLRSLADVAMTCSCKSWNISAANLQKDKKSIQNLIDICQTSIPHAAKIKQKTWGERESIYIFGTPTHTHYMMPKMSRD